MHRVNASVNLNVQQRSHSQGRRTVIRAPPTEAWEHADLENRCFGSFRLCGSTFDTRHVQHHTAKDVQSALADRRLKSEPKLI